MFPPNKSYKTLNKGKILIGFKTEFSSFKEPKEKATGSRAQSRKSLKIIFIIQILIQLLKKFNKEF